MQRFFYSSRKPPATLPVEVPLGGTRQQAMQRLQIGLTGVTLMILLVGLASIVQNRAKETDATAVPEAAPTTEPTESANQSDPLVEAGVVPEMPSVPNPSPSDMPADRPEGGNESVEN